MGYSYEKLYAKNAAFYHTHPTARKALPVLDKLFTAFFGIAYVGLWVYAVFWGGFVARDFIRIAFIPLLTLFLVSLLRAMIARPRPYAQAGANIVPLKGRKGREDDSFPSRHLACAAAIVFCFFPALPIVGGGLVALAIALAYVRFALGLHYPSDLVAGGAVGSIVAGLYYLIEYVFAFLA